LLHKRPAIPLANTNKTAFQSKTDYPRVCI